MAKHYRLPATTPPPPNHHAQRRSEEKRANIEVGSAPSSTARVMSELIAAQTADLSTILFRARISLDGFKRVVTFHLKTSYVCFLFTSRFDFLCYPSEKDR
ncbi:hypothetical protein INR49_025795 [Caranx melampygus]|nr:hypothetical protein INR49_025795 [Caranx melampygus]